LLALIAGIGIGAAEFLAAPLIASLGGLHDESRRLYVGFIRILSFSAPMSGVLFVSNACLRGAGDTKLPFFVTLSVFLVNTPLTIALVLTGHGVYGIATGTAIAWACGAVLAVAVLASGRGAIT